jgi:hypothetical protein
LRAFLCYPKNKITSYLDHAIEKHNFLLQRLLLASLLLLAWFSGIPSVAVVPLVPDVTVAGLHAIASVTGVDGVSAVSFPVVSDVPAVAGFPAVSGSLLMLASLLILASIHNLAGIFTNCTNCIHRDNWTIGLSEYDYQTAMFFFYRTIGISNIGFANSRNYRISDQGLSLSDYRTHKKLAVAKL